MLGWRALLCWRSSVDDNDRQHQPTTRRSIRPQASTSWVDSVDLFCANRAPQGVRRAHASSAPSLVNRTLHTDKNWPLSMPRWGTGATCAFDEARLRKKEEGEEEKPKTDTLPLFASGRPPELSSFCALAPLFQSDGREGLSLAV